MRGFFVLVLISFLFVPVFLNSKVAIADDRGGAVIAPFQQEDLKKYRDTAQNSEDAWKHKILFIMGVILLVLIFATAGFGMTMALRGKDFFVQHMLCAGATVFLAVAHAVTSIVWFYPF